MTYYLPETPSQTAGPYVHIGTLPAAAGLSIRPDERLHVIANSGPVIRIEGVIYDGNGSPVPDGIIELWQANPDGLYNAPGFSGWGRATTGGPGTLWSFETLKPGPTVWRDGRMQAPHVSLLIFARGINIHLHTRLYFPEDSEAQVDDPILQLVDPPHRRETMIARATRDVTRVTVYRLDIHLQGHDETVFFDA